jgi:hypothetical protein
VCVRAIKCEKVPPQLPAEDNANSNGCKVNVQKACQHGEPEIGVTAKKKGNKNEACMYKEKKDSQLARMA